MKKKYLKPEQWVLEMPTSTLLLGSLQTNLQGDEKITIEEEETEEGFWGR